MIDHNALEDLRKFWTEIETENSEREERVWNSLDYETQLDVFCAVVRRLVQGELYDGQSYRGVLYGAFGFDMDAYIRAQMAGFLELHNSIRSGDEILNVVESFAKDNGLELKTTEIEQYLREKHIL